MSAPSFRLSPKDVRSLVGVDCAVLRVHDDKSGFVMFSYLVTMDGFEILFPTGITRWSSVTNSKVEAFLRNSETKTSSVRYQPRKFLIRKNIKVAKKFMKRAKVSKPTWYSERSEAIRVETDFLDQNRSEVDWPQYHV
jgi:hypothetical protein